MCVLGFRVVCASVLALQLRCVRMCILLLAVSDVVMILAMHVTAWPPDA